MSCRLVTLALLLLSATAFAASAASKANALAKEGDKLYKDGKYKEAAEALKKAYDIDPNPTLIFNIARAYVALAEPDSAFAWLERSSWQWPHRAVQSDPALDGLRADPRFLQLAARIEREMGMQPKLALR